MKEKKEDNFNDLDSFNGRHAFISESFILIAANQIEESSKEKNLLPSAILNLVNIPISPNEDSWDAVDFRKDHYLNMSVFRCFINEGENNFNIQDILAFLEEAKFILPKIKYIEAADWPYLFFGQIQIFCQLKKIKPSIVLGFFNINFDLGEKDDWEVADWTSLLVQESINLVLHPSIIITKKN